MFLGVDYIKTGDRITISDGDKEVKCKIEVADISAGKFTTIAPSGALKLGGVYNLSLLRHDGFHSTSGVVKSVSAPDDSAALGLEYTIKLSKPFEKLQKRSYVRQDCHLPVKLYSMSSLEHGDGIIINISAGGAKIVTNIRLNMHDEIKIRTKLNNIVLNADGVLLEVFGMDKMTSAYKYGMRMSFVNFTKKNEDIIVKYIFNEYRKKRSK